MSFEEIGKRETLPEKVSKSIKESILNGELVGGDALPTEPELEKQFGVSRAVIRDAMRMLKAQGLIVVKHGKGMFVSHSQMEAFTDALLTTLKRENATVWDVEQFEQIFMPQALAIAAVEATEEDLDKVKENAKKYMIAFEHLTKTIMTKKNDVINEALDKSQKVLKLFYISVFECTHNKMMCLIGEVLLNMRKYRTIETKTDLEEIDFNIIDIEKEGIDKFIRAIESRDPEEASKIMRDSTIFDSSWIEVCKKTPVGTSPVIPSDIFLKNIR